MQLIQCKPYRVRLTAEACASQYRTAQHGDTTNPHHRLNCVGCPVGKANAAGKDSGAEVSDVESKGTPPRGRKATEMPRRPPDPKPDRKCDHCNKMFKPHRNNQRFCPGGACGVEHQAAKKRKEKASTKDAPGVAPTSPERGRTTKIYPADLENAHAVVMSAVEENPDLFAGLSAAALPVLARKVAAALVRASEGTERR